MASKNLQKSSAIQNISITLSSVIIAIFVCNPLFFSTIKLQQISLITKFISTYNSSNSRYLAMNVQIEESCEKRLQPEFEKDYFRALTDFVRNEYSQRSEE